MKEPIISTMCRSDFFKLLNVEWQKWLSLLQIPMIAPLTDTVVVVDGQELPDLAAAIAQLDELEDNAFRSVSPLLPAAPVSCPIVYFPLRSIVLHGFLSFMNDGARLSSTGQTGTDQADSGCR